MKRLKKIKFCGKSLIYWVDMLNISYPTMYRKAVGITQFTLGELKEIETITGYNLQQIEMNIMKLKTEKKGLENGNS